MALIPIKCPVCGEYTILGLANHKCLPYWFVSFEENSGELEEFTRVRGKSAEHAALRFAELFLEPQVDLYDVDEFTIYVHTNKGNEWTFTVERVVSVEWSVTEGG